MSAIADTPVLTAVVLTLNEAENIRACIESLDWADRILVFDSCSEDETVTLAQAAGAEVACSRFENFAQQRNAALDVVESDWVFFIDADERGTPALGSEVRRVIKERPETGWYVPRHNYIFGKLTRCAGWFPDYQLRLFRHGRVRYRRPVHEIAEVDGAVGYLEQPLIHHNYRDTAEFHETQRRYAVFEADILYQAGVRPRPFTFVTMPARQFWWRFVSLKGYQAGWHGLRLSLFMAYYELVKYRRVGRAASLS